MKKFKHVLLFLLLITSFLFSSMETFAIENAKDNDISYDSIKDDVIIRYGQIEKSVWKKYFKKQAKITKKIWKKSVVHSNTKYDTSYLRVLLFINEHGQIISYKTMSSCMPYKDETFKQEVEKVLSSVKFTPLPKDYKYHFLVFTIKFHSKLPANINSSRINWDSYGIADIELANKSFKTIIKD